MRTTFLALALLTASVSAQQASYTYIDQKAPYSNPGGLLTALNLPKLGATFQVQVPSSSWLSHYPYYLLATGVSNPDVPIAPLSGFLFTSAEHVVITTIQWLPGFPVTMSFPIPNSSQLLGTRFYQQVLYVRNCGPFGPACPKRLSRGGVGTIGL